MGSTSQGARAIAKKLGHAEAGEFSSAFRGLKPTQEAAEGVIQSIMQNPSRTHVGQAVDVYGTNGMGVRFDGKTGKFITFLEEQLATR